MSRRTRIVAAGGAALLVGGFALTPAAFGDAAPAKYPAAEVHRPSPMPDRVVLTPTTTPATSQKVTWRAEATTEWAQAQILAAPKALGSVTPATGAVRTVPASSSTSVNTSLGYASTYHTVEFTGLSPDTRYTYRVGDGTNWSEWADFTTADSSLDPFSFIYYGDAQNYLDSAVPRVFRQAFADRPEAKMIVNAGDLIDSANSEEQWGQWFKAGGFIDSQVNNISVPGNHEYSGGLSSFWRPQFPYPDNGPGNPELKQTAYQVDYQGVRFIGLDTNHQSNSTLMAAQTAWLEGLLRDNPNKWTVVTFHHPVYSTTGTRNNPNVRDQWGPLFEKYGVDLVLQGHDHSYGRGNVAAKRQSTTVHNGVAYVVSVSGGKMYALNNGENWTGNGAEVVSKGQNIQLYQLIDVQADQIRFEARYANGEHHDGFLIRKNAAGERTVNELRTPENTVSEQATVNRTTVETKGRVKVSAYGYDPGEKVTVYLRNTKAEQGRNGVFIGYQTADELGRLSYSFELPPTAKKNSTHVVYLTSDNQKITSPVVTVTK
ncbi:metallophosphoesterase family protein [Micromonospora sp. NBC_01655]|uniref:purple acid phosphatase family protein n=1 Tax=Micromonospora sp. NBC_01655 TaxID=2975983 RepID=UPI00225881F4|nr:metallophosphoesterase family protein [Micromonospora sp. NBC_01655]MCX4471765.1 metallophosphoesterase family protein [Micromonospora sp. NBC_01655]